MKLCILFVLACLQVSAKGFGQGTVTISLKDVPVTEVFREIEKQTSFRFLYRDELVKRAGHVSISVKDAPVGDVLDRCLSKSKLEYKIFNATIVISEKGEEVHQGGGASLPETSLPPINVTGRVLNEQGKPVEGVTVTIKGTDKSTFTNANGEFSMSSVEQDAVLVFTSVNMESFELRVSGRTELVVNLKAKVNELGDVEVVHTGYQQIERERATGSFVRINKELLNRRVSTDILSRLEGVASGVLFDRFSNSKAEISIRGRSTIYANTQPLIVVDNFPYNGELNDINPNDIESITILKDAAAASIWGAFSGNGVIVITTKKGRYNQPMKVEVNSNFTFEEKPDLYYDQEFLNSSDFINVETTLFQKGYYDDDLNNTTVNPPISPVVEILAKRRSGLITSSDSATLIDQLRSYDIRNDYSKYFYRTATRQQYALNLSGGNTSMSYYLSGGYDKNINNNVGNQFERISLNSLLAFRPIKKLEVSGQIVFTQSKADNNGAGSISSTGKYQTIYPYAQLADPSGNYLPVMKDYRLSFATTPPVAGLMNWLYYPLEELSLNSKTRKGVSNRILANIKYTIIDNLNLELKYQFQKESSASEEFYDRDSYFVRNLVNQFSTVTGNSVSKRNIPEGSIMNIINSELISNSARVQASYNNSWQKHSVSAIAGINIQETKSRGSSSRVYGYDPNTGTSIPVNFESGYSLYPTGFAVISGAPGLFPGTTDRFRSFFANGSYTLNDRYTISVSARMDQSNLFGVKTNQKMVPLWSVGAKWDINKERFYKSGLFPLLRIRATYGYNGNLDKSLTAFTIGRYTSGDLINNYPFVAISSPGNPELRWEKIGMFNMGVDFESRNQVISGSIEYFQKRGRDLIGTAIIPSSTGYQTIKGNYSDMKGKGIDVTLNTINTRGRFNWTSNLLFSYAADKITKNEGNNSQIVGKPVQSLFAYRWAGLDPTNGDPMGYLTDTSKSQSKDYAAFSDQKTADQKYIGSGSPQIFGSLRNSLTWKGVTLSANIIFKAKYYFKRSSISYNSLYSRGSGHSDFVKRWQKPGDENSTNIPSMVYIDYPGFSSRNTFYLGSEALVERGDHIRLQDISISYDLSANRKMKLPFESIQIYFYANNLGILWQKSDKGVDPDFQTNYPSSKTYSAGVRIRY